MMTTKRQNPGRQSRAAYRAFALVIPLIMLITGCERSSQAGVGSGGTTGSPSTTSTAPSVASPSSASPSSASPSPEALVDLAPGYHVVDVVTGETSLLPVSVTSFRGVANLEVSPDGSMLLFDNSRYRPGSDLPGLHQIYVANVNGSGVRQATRDPVGASSGSWAPDGSSIVFVGGVADLNGKSPDRHFGVLDLETGETTSLLTNPGPPWFDGPRFASDGRSIVFSRWVRPRGTSLPRYLRNDLWALPLEGGDDPRMILKGRGYADPSPDGRSILYPRIMSCANGTLAELWISDADRSDARVLAPARPDCLSAWAEAGWSPNGKWIAYTQGVAFPLPRRAGVYVVNLRTRERTLVAFGYSADWLDDRTLIVRAVRVP